LDNNPLNNVAQKKIIDDVLVRNSKKPGALMVVLNELQGKIGFVSATMQQYVAEQLKIPVSLVHGVVSFYSFFTTSPRGKHTVKFCMGTACYVGGTDQLIEKVKQVLKVNPGETTPDGEITIEICRCVGACSQAPVITVDDQVQGRIKPNKIPQIINGLLDAEKVIA
jgi:NADH-quinone oxidoreductase subunit E